MLELIKPYFGAFVYFHYFWNHETNLYLIIYLGLI